MWIVTSECDLRDTFKLKLGKLDFERQEMSQYSLFLNLLSKHFLHNKTTLMCLLVCSLNTPSSQCRCLLSVNNVPSVSLL